MAECRGAAIIFYRNTGPESMQLSKEIAAVLSCRKEATLSQCRAAAHCSRMEPINNAFPLYGFHRHCPNLQHQAGRIYSSSCTQSTNCREWLQWSHFNSNAFLQSKSTAPHKNQLSSAIFSMTSIIKYHLRRQQTTLLLSMSYQKKVWLGWCQPSLILVWQRQGS